jgi:hypothetical protein
MQKLQTHYLDRTQRMREAVLLMLCESADYSQLQKLSFGDWKRLLYWLDISGLALYFLDRIMQSGQSEMLPSAVLLRLQENLADNTQRTAAMISELIAIHRSFQSAGLSYAMLKGFSLWPISVPKLELRSQLDIDFLMAEESAPTASAILKKRGYGLHAISGRSWEFHSGNMSEGSLKDLYKATPQRTVELHLEASNAGAASLLTRTDELFLCDDAIPVLSPVDLFLGQGLHVYKHVCSPGSRVAHHAEFRRHIIARYHDDAFWKELRKLAEQNPRAPAALGLVTLLITHVMGDFAPTALTCWTVDRVPAAACLWVELYGHRSVLDSFPGTKLYLLLQQAMEQAGVSAKRPVRQALLPRRLPPAIAHGVAGESVSMRSRRYRKQFFYTLSRLRFHVVEGLRYLYESARWQKRIRRHELRLRSQQDFAR